MSGSLSWPSARHPACSTGTHSSLGHNLEGVLLLGRFSCFPETSGKFEHRALGTFPLTMRHSCVASMSSADHSTSLRSGIHGFTVRGLADVANPVSKSTQQLAAYHTSSLKDLGLETSLSDSSRIDPSLTPFEHITTRIAFKSTAVLLGRSDVVLLSIHSLISTEYYH